MRALGQIGLFDSIKTASTIHDDNDEDAASAAKEEAVK